MTPMKYVMTYRAVDDFLPLAREHGPAHVERLRDFHGRGVLLMVGTFELAPSQLQALNPIMVMLLIPVNNFVLFPWFER